MTFSRKGKFMQTIEIRTKSRPSTVFCGAGAADEIGKVTGGKQLFVLTDSNVYNLYKAFISEKFRGASVCVVPAGEKNKNRKTLFYALDAMLDAHLRRNGMLVALGGGVVGDMGGLAASLYMRGISAVQIPTTLLAQVDSSVGGKTAIDYRGVKNVIGAFYQPEHVICDPLFLKTLPERELRCGLGEIIKSGALDEGIFRKLCENSDRLYEYSFLEDITADCVKFKAGIVEKDECEKSGLRKCLNMGHTTGHALELYYGRRSHGEYVLIGMIFESYIAQREGVCDAGYAEELRSLIGKVIRRLPVFKNIEEAAGVALYDKKNEGKDEVSLILPKEVGKYCECRLPLRKYIGYLKEINGGNA